ncbi:MAG: PAS domain-containing protein [Planctomycetes bacterium]|nr:PAS domain-containing protein [Planctomycetota bacterium]
MTGQPNQTGLPADSFCRQLFQNVQVALVAVDADFNVTCCNQTASMLLAVAPLDAVGRPVHQLVPENCRNLLDKMLRRAMARREPAQFDMSIPLPDSQTRCLMAVLSPIRDDQDRDVGAAIWLADRTESRRMAERLAAADRMAAIAAFAGGVAHHFNNIMGAITTSVDHALTSGDYSAMRKALQIAADGTARAARITQAMLAFAERDSRRSEPADCAEILINFSRLIERPLAKRNIKLALDLKPTPPVRLDSNRMHQILGNLLTNAEEAMPAGGQISLGLDAAGDEIVVTFADTGCGIRPEHLGKIFQPFFTTKGPLHGGSQNNPGLGLAMVHGMVMDMGGRIFVESEPDRGAKFSMFFPVRPRPAGMEED